MIITLGLFLALVGALGLLKYRQIKIAMSMPWSQPPEAVTTVVAKEESWVSSQAAIGTVVAVQGVVLSADLPGVVQEITFDSGRWVKEGEVLVRLDTSQERAQLAAAEAQLDLAKLNLERAKELSQKQVISQAEFDRWDAEAKTAEATAESYRATISRKTIRAPFSGILGIRQVNLGQYLAGGDPIVPLQSLDPIYVNFNVPQQVMNSLKVGDEVRVAIEGDSVTVDGKISAINSLIDASTRNVEVQASFRNPKKLLRPGMFVEIKVMGDLASNVIALPVSAINYAPYGDSVFIVEDVTGEDGTTYKGVRQQFVKLGGGRGDQVAVLSGVKPGEEIVSSGVFKLRPGAAVEVNNTVTPSNDPAPKPEDS
ncbi:MAG TPA: efflux RND transporter periplasmic adaptor subunit [Candidatus Krumholzibacteria bacterium]|nr:efflux RND transporter periplasmic adaptor subunit [Candidatus Krumholzibacteria bacterium]